MKDFEFDVVDDQSPSIDGNVAGRALYEGDLGPVWTNRETEPAGVNIADEGFGLTAGQLLMFDGVDTQTLWSTDLECAEPEPFVTTHVCPESASHELEIPTGSLPEGKYEFGALATSYAGAQTVAGPVTIGVDRTSASQPTGVTAHGAFNGHGWTTSPGATLSWDPPPDQPETSAPISGAAYDLRRPGAEPTLTGTTEASVLETPPVTLAQGEWEFGVRFPDEAGNPGERASVTVGYDSDSPVKPDLHEIGWVSRDALVAGHDATWTPAGQPATLESKVCGFGFSVDTNPFASAPSREDAPAAATSVRLPVRSAGVHQAHLNAMSCAGLPSTSDTEDFHVDSRPPDFGDTVVPQGWSRVAPTFVLQATDLDGAGAAGSGVKSVSWELSSGDQGTSPGDSALVTPTDGDTSITYSAVDETGNESSPRTIAFNIDTQGPTVAAARDGASDPRVVSVRVTDAKSGVGDIWLERRAPGGRWQESGGHASPPLPGSPSWTTALSISDAGLPAGDYEFRVVARDTAGNLGEDLISPVRVPLRAQVSISAAIADIRGGVIRRSTAARSVVRPWAARVALVGQALTDTGEPLSRVTLAVSETEEFSTAPRLFTVVTDEDGRFSRRLGSGASRDFVVRLEGDDLQSPGEATASLKVRAGLTLKPSSHSARGGQVTKFTGRLLGSASRVPPGGKSISLRYLRPDGSWSNTGNEVKIGENGRFRIVRPPWPKSGKAGTVWFRVRAVREENEVLWPFETGSSDPVKIRLRP